MMKKSSEGGGGEERGEVGQQSLHALINFMQVDKLIDQKVNKQEGQLDRKIRVS